MPIHQAFTVQDITFTFLSGDGIITRPNQEISDNFNEIMKEALELYNVFEQVSFVVEMGHYDKYTEEHILNTLELMHKVNYPKSWVTEELCDGFAGYLTKKKKQEAKKTKKRKPGYVYLLQSPSAAYKIGRTKAPQNRLKTFAVNLPFEVEYIALIQTNDMAGLERQLHQRFADKRVNGEWFELSSEDVQYIQGLSNGQEK
jgi:hypothetical protein